MDIFILQSKANKLEIVYELFSVLYMKNYIKESNENVIYGCEPKFPTALELCGSFNVVISHGETKYLNNPANVLAILENSIQREKMEDTGVSIPIYLVFLLAINEPKLVVPNLKAFSDEVLCEPKIVTELKNSNKIVQTKKTLEKSLT